MTKKSRVPKVHAESIIAIVKQFAQPQPRFILAKELQRYAPELKLKTCMDYILSSANEGILNKIGTTYGLK